MKIHSTYDLVQIENTHLVYRAVCGTKGEMFTSDPRLVTCKRCIDPSNKMKGKHYATR